MPLRLPKPAAAILSRIRVENEQRLALRRTNASLVRALKTQRGEAIGRKQYLEDQKRQGRLYREARDHEGNVTETPDNSMLDAANEEIADIDAQLARLAAADATPRATAVRLESELDEFSRYAVSPTRVALKEGEMQEAALSRLRAAIERTKEERTATTKAKRTYEEVRERAMNAIRALAERGVPKVLQAFQGGEIEWPKARVPNPGSPTLTFVPDGAALVAWLFQAELERRVDSLLDFCREDEAALSASEQTARLQEVDDRLMALYREEAATVEAIVAAGGSAYHLADRPAMAVLGIRLA